MLETANHYITNDKSADSAGDGGTSTHFTRLLEGRPPVELDTPPVPAIEAAPKPADSPADSARRRRPLRTILIALGIGAALVGSAVFWLSGGRYASTDDANVQAANAVITTDVSGLVDTVNVVEGQRVKRGDLLFQLQLEEFQYAVDRARSQLDETELTIKSMKNDYQALLNDVSAQEAQVELDKLTHERAATLTQDNVVSKAQLDNAEAALKLDTSKLDSLKQQAAAQLARLDGDPDIAVADHPLYRQAQAELDEAVRELDHASVRAPFDGVVTKVDTLQPGDFLVAQTAALTGAGAIALVATDHAWIEAQLKETDLTYVKEGNPVTITIDTYPGRVWTGVVDSVSPASGAEFSVLPPENTSGNFVKVVQRIPVRINIATPEGSPTLRAGMSATVWIDTGHRRSLLDLL